MFTYNDIEIPKEYMGISPSGINKFFKYPKLWYLEAFKGEKDFIGNTATVLGTIVHQTIESYIKGELDSNTDAFKEKVKNYVYEQKEVITDLDVDHILRSYEDMAAIAVNDFCSTTKFDAIELGMKLDLGDNVILKGTTDAISGDCIIDWKTIGTFTAPKEIPWAYKIQGMAYAKMAIANGYDITRLMFGFITTPAIGRISEKTGKPMKDYYATFTPLYHQITKDDWKELDDTLQLMKDSINLVKEKPELAYIVFKSMELKTS